jgi:16S rRNA G966 N2-methylase RsmD
MRLQTMSNIQDVLPEALAVGRGDPVYMAHAYLTKVPVTAILPFIYEYTSPDDVIADPFAGSGMTGVAAAASGRKARLFDISVLGQHIGRNYVNLVDPDLLRKHAREVVDATSDDVGAVYSVRCDACRREAELAKTVWSSVVQCATCGQSVNYYTSLELAGWKKSDMSCTRCGSHVSARLRKIGEEPVVDYVDCSCSRTQLEQTTTITPVVDVSRAGFPDVEITSDRQMYQASALGRHGLTTVASFYSPRNLAVLGMLNRQIQAVADETLRNKLLFAFTACLTRASKRYQWSRQRPLNAANANYYVAPIFYEWNVFDLFLRKVEAIIRSDNWVREQLGVGTLFDSDLDVTYELGSAAAIELAAGSVDYVFTDPPFGSNLFYADMALFHEAWLDGFTEVALEAVIDRGRKKVRTASRYEQLLTDALTECRRVLKPNGRISMVFGNSSGAMWALVQRAISAAGLEIEPDKLVVLDKGQRSVKGLASGFEHVATLDLIITMRNAGTGAPSPRSVEAAEIVEVVNELALLAQGRSPSHLYLELLRRGLRNGWALQDLDLRVVTSTLLNAGWSVDSGSGVLRSDAPEPVNTN